MLVDQYGNKIEKGFLQYTDENPMSSMDSRNKRGHTVYSPSQLMNITGRDKEGRLVKWGVEYPYFYLTIRQRIDMFRLSSPVFGVVTSRMNKISGLSYNVITEKDKEDEIAYSLKDYKSVYDEYQNSLDITHLTVKAKMVLFIREYLPDVLEDLSNFNGALIRWKRRLYNGSKASCREASEWLSEPNQNLKWEDFVKKFIFDLLIHGASAVYKDVEDGKITNFDLLPGGTVYRIKAPYFSGVAGYVQMVPGYMEPGIYFSDEMSYFEYAPNSSRNYGMIPLEALINKVSESLLFDDLMANQADGTKFPEKVIVVTDPSPFGSMDSGVIGDLPIDAGEQERLGEKVNTPVKGSIMTFSGNDAKVLDLSKENTMATQMARQKDIREEVALVFNATNMEMNLTGSEGTSGRSTSEAQSEIEQGRGTAPQAKALENFITRDILPYRFGPGLIFELEKSKNEMEEKQLDLLMLQTGEMTQNEIREKYGKGGFGEDYDKPIEGGGGETGDSEMNPMFTQGVG